MLPIKYTLMKYAFDTTTHLPFIRHTSGVMDIMLVEAKKCDTLGIKGLVYDLLNNVRYFRYLNRFLMVSYSYWYVVQKNLQKARQSSMET